MVHQLMHGAISNQTIGINPRGGVAQLARASRSYREGRRFEPYRRYQIYRYSLIVKRSLDTRQWKCNSSYLYHLLFIIHLNLFVLWHVNKEPKGVSNGLIE